MRIAPGMRGNKKKVWSGSFIWREALDYLTQNKQDSTPVWRLCIRARYTKSGDEVCFPLRLEIVQISLKG